MTLRPLALVLAFGALAGGAGLSLAQDQNQVANVVGAPSQALPPENLTGPVAPLALPPVDEAPPPEPSPPPPPVAAEPADNAAGDSADNVVAAAPPPAPTRPHYGSVVLQALDKVTAETLRFEARVNEPVRYKDLVITVHACETQASDEPYNQTAAHMEVQYQPDVLPGRGAATARMVFRGWMFGEAPGLHPFEHPIYDLWVIACRTPSAAATPPPPSPAGANL